MTGRSCWRSVCASAQMSSASSRARPTTRATQRETSSATRSARSSSVRSGRGPSPLALMWSLRWVDLREASGSGVLSGAHTLGFRDNVLGLFADAPDGSQDEWLGAFAEEAVELRCDTVKPFLRALDVAAF